MNNTFDWNRFCKVVNKDFRNMWPLFGPTMLILAALPFAIWLFMLVLNHHSIMDADIRLIILEGLAMLAAIMAPSRMYRTWNLRNEGIYFAMLPASKLEKYLSAILFSLIVCPLAVYLGGMLLDVVLTALPFGPWREWLWQSDFGFPFTFQYSDMMDAMVGDDSMAIEYGSFVVFMLTFWLSYISSVMLFLFTSTLFKRHKVLQTILWIYVIEFALSIIIILVFIGVRSNPDMMEWMGWIYDTFVTVDPQAGFDLVVWASLVFDVIIAVLFGWLSWRRLKRMPY